MLISKDSRRRCFKKWRLFRSQDPRGPVRVAMKTWNLSQAPLHLLVQILLNIPQILMSTCRVRPPTIVILAENSSCLTAKVFSLASRAESIECKMKWIHFQF